MAPELQNSIEKKINWSKRQVILTMIGLCITCMITAYQWQRGIFDAISSLDRRLSIVENNQSNMKGRIDEDIMPEVKGIKNTISQINGRLIALETE